MFSSNFDDENFPVDDGNTLTLSNFDDKHRSWEHISEESVRKFISEYRYTVHRLDVDNLIDNLNEIKDLLKDLSSNNEDFSLLSFLGLLDHCYQTQLIQLMANLVLIEEGQSKHLLDTGTYRAISSRYKDDGCDAFDLTGAILPESL